jgi:5-formyltetrahydrofolate cyclo-ligase
MTDPLLQAKRHHRRDLRTRLAQLTPAFRRQASASVRARLEHLPQWLTSRSALLFHSLADEPDTLPLLGQRLARNQITALPCFDPATQSYLARRVLPSPAGPLLAPGAFGIPEPPATSPVIPWNQLDFVLVPGLGFAPDGRRLGKGRGYYDRLLRLVRAFRCGIAFDEQIIEDLPAGPHDERLDCILTPSRRWDCLRARL